jgi:hypothetical protein
MRARSCLNCASIAICDILGMFKDDDGRIETIALDIIGSDCKKFISDKLSEL